ncbi:MAG: hypothetical protein E6Q97_39365 [Desulfurellales bacterium]|nr:MAG: hypothetical protein E6Q97_39365 [Desulfurellales bacterium]
MPEIIFDADFPSVVRSEMERLLNDTVWLCPIWLQKLFIGFGSQADDPDAAARFILQKDYRWARLQVTMDFFTSDNPREMLIHELVHAFTIPLKTCANDAFQDLGLDQKLYDVLFRQLDKSMEQVTQDFAFVIEKRLQCDLLSNKQVQ